jgi:hypothetical protein
MATYLVKGVGEAGHQLGGHEVRVATLELQGKEKGRKR